MRSLKEPFRHLHAANGVLRKKVPTDRGSQDLTHKVAQVIGRLPREPLPEFFKDKLPDLDSRDIAEALIWSGVTTEDEKT
jgi:hypothetical protein